MSGGQLSESVNNVVDKVVDSSKAVINNAMSNIDPFLSTNDPITTVVSFFSKIFNYNCNYTFKKFFWCRNLENNFK